MVSWHLHRFKRTGKFRRTQKRSNGDFKTVGEWEYKCTVKGCTATRWKDR